MAVSGVRMVDTVRTADDEERGEKLRCGLLMRICERMVVRSTVGWMSVIHVGVH